MNVLHMHSIAETQRKKWIRLKMNVYALLSLRSIVPLILLNPYYFESFSINCILIRRNRFNAGLHYIFLSAL